MLPRHYGGSPRLGLRAHRQRQDDRFFGAHPGLAPEAWQGLRQGSGGGPLPGAREADLGRVHEAHAGPQVERPLGGPHVGREGWERLGAYEL